MTISFPTQSECIQEIIKQMSMVPGTSVQVYAEDIIASYFQSAFDEIFDSYFWPEYTSWQTFTLDGTIGIPNANIDTYVKRIQDIGTMFIGGTRTPIHRMPSQENPSLVTGTSPKFYDAYTATRERVFRVYPAASTGTLDCRVRTKPADFISTSVIYLDKWLPIFRAAWLYAEQDAANPGLTAVFQNRFEERMLQVKSSIASAAPIPVNPSAGSGIETEWR